VTPSPSPPPPCPCPPPVRCHSGEPLERDLARVPVTLTVRPPTVGRLNPTPFFSVVAHTSRGDIPARITMPDPDTVAHRPWNDVFREHWIPGDTHNFQLVADLENVGLPYEYTFLIDVKCAEVIGVGEGSLSARVCFDPRCIAFQYVDLDLHLTIVFPGVRPVYLPELSTPPSTLVYEWAWEYTPVALAMSRSRGRFAREAGVAAGDARAGAEPAKGGAADAYADADADAYAPPAPSDPVGDAYGPSADPHGSRRVAAGVAECVHTRLSEVGRRELWRNAPVQFTQPDYLSANDTLDLSALRLHLQSMLTTAGTTARWRCHTFPWQAALFALPVWASSAVIVLVLVLVLAGGWVSVDLRAWPCAPSLFSTPPSSDPRPPAACDSQAAAAHQAAAAAAAATATLAATLPMCLCLCSTFPRAGTRGPRRRTPSVPAPTAGTFPRACCSGSASEPPSRCPT
jgi:hypothetical protein